MKRRDLLRIAGGAVVLALPVLSQTGRPKRVGFMGNVSPADPGVKPVWTAFLDGLGDLGWAEGRNLVIDARWAEGRPERYPAMADELVALDLDVIVAPGSQQTQALKERTSTIPIVMVGVSHPVDAGYVASLARPGGNITGLTNQLSDLILKYAELMRELVPDLQRFAVVWEPDNAGSRLGFTDFAAQVPKAGLTAVSAPLRAEGDLEGAFETLIRERAQALWVHPTPIAGRRREDILAFVTENRLPTLTSVNIQMRAGYLLSYGPDWPEMYRRAAAYVDRLLHGARPSDLPVEQPTRFTLGINLASARRIGLMIPPALLARADEVIE